MSTESTLLAGPREAGGDTALAAMHPGSGAAMTRHIPETVKSAPTIEAMLLAAIEKGVDAASIEKLVGVFERVNAQRAEQAFNAAMKQFRQEVGPIIKVKTAEFGTKNGGRASYNYAPLEEITKVVDPILYLNGLTYHWDARLDGKLTTVTCYVNHVEGHQRSSSFTCEGGGSPLMNSAQVSASAVTFARRYSLVLALGLTTDEDDDGRRAVPMPQPDVDPNAPRVGTRAERAAQQPAQEPDDGTPRVTKSMMGNAIAEWKRVKRMPDTAGFPEFAEWAQKALRTELDMKQPGNWTVDALDAVREALL